MYIGIRKKCRNARKKLQVNHVVIADTVTTSINVLTKRMEYVTKKEESAEQEETSLGTEEELIELCTKWQNILGLQAWDVALRVCRGREMTLEASSGVAVTVFIFSAGVLAGIADERSGYK